MAAKLRVGIVGYGVQKFGAEFGFQDHPNSRGDGCKPSQPALKEGELLKIPQYRMG